MNVPPGPLPWSLVLKIAAGTAVPLLAAAFRAPDLVPATGAGLAVGVAAVQGNLGRAGLGAGMALAAAFALPSPVGLDPRMAAFAIAAAAGWEAARTGGRSLTFALVSAVLLTVGFGYNDAPGPSVAVFLASALWSGLVVSLLGLVGLAAVPPAGTREGLRHALFLGLGLALSLTLVESSDEPLALWIVSIFLYRAVVPATQAIERLLVYACGAVTGIGLALALELIGPPGPIVRAGVAAVAALVGLRAAAMLSPVAGASFTLALLLVAAPTPAAAIFRLEAVLFVALLVALLAELLSRILGPPPDQPSKL